MLGNNIEKRIIQDADKIASMKENIDALSWERVLDIGKQLSVSRFTTESADLVRELISIAKANLSLENRLGIRDISKTAVILPSGVPVPNNGEINTLSTHFEQEKPQYLVESASQDNSSTTAAEDSSVSLHNLASSLVESNAASTPTDQQQPTQSASNPEQTNEFRSLYTTKDGSLCLCEDAEGNLVLLDFSKEQA